MTGIELGVAKLSFGKPVKAILKNGQEMIGILNGWTSEVDNDPDGESITMKTPEYPMVEVYTAEIERLEQ